MGLILSVAPSTEPLTTAEAKLHLRVDHSTEDTYIDNLVKAARQHFESLTNYQLLPATWVLTLDRFPRCGEVGTYFADLDILVPKYPIATLTTVSYIDSVGEDGTLTVGTELQLDIGVNPQRIQLMYGQSWPTTRSDRQAVTIQFTAGYANAAAVPNAIKQALLEMVAHWYWHRGEENGRQLPPEVDQLIEPYALSAGI